MYIQSQKMQSIIFKQKTESENKFFEKVTSK